MLILTQEACVTVAVTTASGDVWANVRMPSTAGWISFFTKYFRTTVVTVNPAQGLQFLASIKGLNELIKSLLNTGLIGYVLGFILHDTSFAQAVHQQKALLDIYRSSVAAP